MTNLQIFNNPEFGEVRTIVEGDTILFCGNDVARALGYAVPKDAISTHCKGAVKRRAFPDSGQSMNFIPESDLYRLVFRSKLPTAEKFTDWVTTEVLPTIRKHGAYMTPETLQAAISNPDYLLQIVTALKDETDKRKALEVANSRLIVENQIMQPKADYFDDLVDRNLLTSFRETAKELGVPPRKFTQFLLEHKYIYRDRHGKLLPYEAKNKGLFQIKECTNDKSGWSGIQTLVTPKGRETFRLLCVT